LIFQWELTDSLSANLRYGAIRRPAVFGSAIDPCPLPVGSPDANGVVNSV